MATDPVCGMWVEERPSSLRLVRDNRTYYFCSETCVHQFAEPERELRRLVRRLAVAWPLSIVIVVLTYAAGTMGALVGAAVLAAVVQVYAGGPFYLGTRDALRDRAWNMDVLIAVGTTAAFVYSLAALVPAAGLPHAYYFDASSLIVTLILTGNFLEHRTRARAGSALRRLEELRPETVTLVAEGGERTAPASSVREGDRLRVRPGERFAADGTIVAGRTSVDESLLTGEPLPRARGIGDPVLAGSLNGEGQVEVRATGVGSDTFVAQIGRLLTEAEMSRVPLQRTADRIASVFVPVVLTLALAAAAFWFLVGGAGVTSTVLVFVTVSITACPCAFGIATPAAILVGTGRAAEEGILFRGEDSIERASHVDLVVTDKTGTLTAGAPSVTAILPLEGSTVERVLSLAAAIESGSTHPYARAVLDEARARGVAVPAAMEVLVDPGAGVRGRVDGHEVTLLRWDPASEDPSGPSGSWNDLRARVDAGESVAVVAEDGTPIGGLSFFDPPTAGAAEAVRALAADRIEVIMATGDHPAAARRVADAVGIREVHAGLLPGQKLELIQRLRGAGRTVAFVGDGINDAPALAGADLGVAIGAGAAVAREAGQVVLVRSDVRGVALALRLARRTVAKVRANLSWAIGYNAVLLPIAMGALVPVFGLPVYSALPIAGAAAMGLSSTTVVANSLSLRRVGLHGPSRPASGRATTPH